jgi:hypothetical protein
MSTSKSKPLEQGELDRLQKLADDQLRKIQDFAKEKKQRDQDSGRD